MLNPHKIHCFAMDRSIFFLLFSNFWLVNLCQNIFARTSTCSYVTFWIKKYSISLPLGLSLLLVGLGEGAFEELVLMEMLVVDGAGMDVGVIPRPDVHGEAAAASGLLEGEPVLSRLLGGVLKNGNKRKILNFSAAFLSN